MVDAGVNIGTELYIVNQGTIRCGKVVEVMRSRVMLEWANSRRTMRRAVGVSWDLREWLTSGGKRNTVGLVRYAIPEWAQGELDKAPKLAGLAGSMLLEVVNTQEVKS